MAAGPWTINPKMMADKALVVRAVMGPIVAAVARQSMDCSDKVCARNSRYTRSPWVQTVFRKFVRADLMSSICAVSESGMTLSNLTTNSGMPGTAMVAGHRRALCTVSFHSF